MSFKRWLVFYNISYIFEENLENLLIRVLKDARTFGPRWASEASPQKMFFGKWFYMKSNISYIFEEHLENHLVQVLKDARTFGPRWASEASPQKMSFKRWLVFTIYHTKIRKNKNIN
jgi:hypothetical protein